MIKIIYKNKAHTHLTIEIDWHSSTTLLIKVTQDRKIITHHWYRFDCESQNKEQNRSNKLANRV